MRATTRRRIVGSNAERTRLHNRQVVLGLVRSHQPVGRAEIARISGLSTQAVSNIIAELEGEGFLLTVGRQTQGRGLPPLQYRLNPQGAAALGIEVRPDAMVTALINLEGQTIHTVRRALPDNGPETVLSMADQFLTEVTTEDRLGTSHLLGAGIVMPGPFGRVGISGAGQTALQGWDGIDPVVAFSNRLGLPVLVENDATAAALAERMNGVAKTLRSFCFIYFGTGIGLGVVNDGDVLRGTFGNAGELGHVIVVPGGRACACGNHGCLETYASRLAVRTDLRRAGIEISGIADLERLYAAGDPHLSAWLDVASAPLSQAIGMIENLFDPEAVILGGAMPDGILDHLIDHLTLPVGSVAVRAERPLPRVLRGTSGRMTAALGGAALVLHDTFTPRITARP